MIDLLKRLVTVPDLNSVRNKDESLASLFRQAAPFTSTLLCSDATKITEVDAQDWLVDNPTALPIVQKNITADTDDIHFDFATETVKNVAAEVERLVLTTYLTCARQVDKAALFPDSARHYFIACRKADMHTPQNSDVCITDIEPGKALVVSKGVHDVRMLVGCVLGAVKGDTAKMLSLIVPDTMCRIVVADV
jgi:hypothetical protein